MQQARGRAKHTETWALAIAVAWMLLAQFACVLLWDAGWQTRQTALIHWLVVGVLPPALALWGMRQPAPAR
jgi:hypothetical protein